MTEFDAVVSVRLKDPESEETLSRSFKVKGLEGCGISDPTLIGAAMDKAADQVLSDMQDPKQTKLLEGS